MERKIGEIFEYNGEWYQAIDNKNGIMCSGCVFVNECNECEASSNVVGHCGCKDDNPLIFKKLEKVGVPYEFDGHIFQAYYTFEVPIFTENYAAIREYGNNSKISIEIKQNKEDMEEQHSTENYPIKEEKIAERIANKVGEDIQNQLEKNMNKLKLKPFSLEAAKAGKPVCTRDGRKARIICFDAEGNKPLIVLSKINGQEVILRYTEKGQSDNFHSPTPREDDLMMLPEKKEGWVNVYREESNNNERLIEQTIYKTRKDAFDNACPKGYITTTKINWEE